MLLQHGNANEEIEQSGHRENSHPGARQCSGLTVPKHKDETAAQCVRHEDVANPQQVGMGEPETEQPEHAPVVQGGSSPASGFDSICEQAYTGTEQHGENGDELGVGQQMAKEPDCEIDSGQVSPHRRIEVGRFRHREHLNVHDQNAQHGETAQDVQAGNAAACRGTRIAGCFEWRRALRLSHFANVRHDRSIADPRSVPEVN